MDSTGLKWRETTKTGVDTFHPGYFYPIVYVDPIEIANLRAF